MYIVAVGRQEHSTPYSLYSLPQYHSQSFFLAIFASGREEKIGRASCRERV